MKMKKQNVLALLCLAGLSAVAVGVSTATIKANAASELVFPDEFKVNETYVYGDTLEMPNPENVKIKTGSFSSNAVSSKIVFPDGNEMIGGDYELNETGTYKIAYTNANGVTVEQTFVVNKNYYGVSGKSTAEYTTLPFTSDVKGVVTSLGSGEAFSFNKTINLHDYEDKTLDVCTVYPYLKATIDDAPAATTVSIKVVDAYDETKFVEFYVWAGSDVGTPYYAGAGSSEQPLTGLEQNRNKPQDMTLSYDGEKYKLWTPRRYQSVLTYGKWLASRCSTDLATHGGITLKWDLAKNRMSALNKDNYLITDIDAPEIYGTNLFDLDTFFTTGEVYLKVECYNYSTTSVDVGLSSVFGMTGEDLKDAKIKDTTAPKVEVDVELSKNGGLILEKDKTFYLPKIKSVLDFNYYGNQKINIYKNYGTASQSSVKIVDGSFTPTSVGYYSVVYTATDSYGNEGKYVLDCTVVDKPSMNYTEQKVEKFIGAQVNVLPNIQATGLNNEVKTTVMVSSPDGKLEILPCENGEYKFVPKIQGEYTVKYFFEDNVYIDNFFYTVNCVDENGVYFKNTFAFSPYFIKGASYSLPCPVAYTVGEKYGFNENKAELYVSVDGGEYAKLNDNQMSEYKVEGSSSLRFKAVYGTGETVSEIYPIIDVKFGEVCGQKPYEKYFQGNYANAELQSVNAKYTFDGSEDGKMKFINLISSANFKTYFNFTGSTSNITFRLTSVSNSSEYAEYSFDKTGTSNVTLNLKKYVDGKLIYENGIYTNKPSFSGEYAIAYTGTVMTMDDKTVNTKDLCVNGDLAILEVFVNGVQDGSYLEISQINNQAVKSNVKESKPQFTFTGADGSYVLNSFFDISSCIGSAVFEPVLLKNATLTVTCPDGTVATATDGTKLENIPAGKNYSIDLEQIGQYKVSYTTSFIGASRTNGTEKISSEEYYIINVNDSIAPTVRFKDGSNSKTVVNVKQFTTHKVKEYEVSDNHTAKEDLHVNVMILTDGFSVVANGFNVDKYAFTEVGTYYVYVVAYDELGNNASVYYTVKVTE